MMDPISQRLDQLLGSHMAAAGPNLSARALALSAAYRDSRPSGVAVTDADTALAYALTRMPATGAAFAAALEASLERLTDFAPERVLDVGAGPGTASWYLAERFADAAFTLADSNPVFLKLARALAAGSGVPALVAAEVIAHDLAVEQRALPEADLVVASYALTEIAETALAGVVARLWAATKEVLLIVEPGRPRDFGRLMGVRDQLLRAGGRLVAPCPHEMDCPLSGGDWCHFAVRLARSRTHRRLKGAALGHEDEKYGFLVVARPGVMLEAPPARVLAPPVSTKHSVDLKLCTPGGALAVRRHEKRDGRFAKWRKTGWGDSVSD